MSVFKVNIEFSADSNGYTGDATREAQFALDAKDVLLDLLKFRDFIQKDGVSVEKIIEEFNLFFFDRLNRIP